MTDAIVQTPITETAQSASESVPSSEVGKECLDIIETYRRGVRTLSEKTKSIREIVLALTTATPELTSSECDDALETYLRILEQHSTLNDSRDSTPEPTQTQERDQLPQGIKRGKSPGTTDESSKKQKQDDSDFPWTVREQLSESGLGDNLEATLKLLKAFARDTKFTKASLINSSRAPLFPNSEWSNILAGSAVDLDHVISGSFAISSDNREIELLGGMEVKFGVVKPVKHVKTSGDWFIAWGSYTNAVCYVFPHRREEVNTYGKKILSLFSATTPTSHAAIINLDKSIRTRVGECRHLLLTDPSAFEDLKLFWLNPIGAGSGDCPRKPEQSKRTDYRANAPCHKWNASECNKRASECKYRHLCEVCGKNHRRSECKTKQGGA